MATLALRAFLASTAAAGMSTTILFLDLTKAFDDAVREVVLGWLGPLAGENVTLDARIAHLVRLGVPSDIAGEVAAEITKTGGLLKELLVDVTVRGAAAALHSGAWFQLRGDSAFLHTVCGGRQGCRLGALIFNLAYSVALSRIRHALADLGVTLHIIPKAAFAPPRDEDGHPSPNAPCEVPGAPPFWMSRGAVLTTERCPYAVAAPEATYVDDHVAMIVATSARKLLDAAPRVLQIMRNELARLGFVINWAPSKTEAFVSLRGAHSHDGYRGLAAAGWTIKAGYDDAAPHLRIVQAYKYLGSWVAADGGVANDPNHRATSMLSVYAPLAWKVFAATALPRQTRLKLFWSLCISRLLYGVETWMRIPAAAYATLNAAYHRGLRRIAGRIKAGGAPQISNEKIRIELGVPSLACLLVRRRLLLLISVARSEIVHLRALLSCAVAGGRQMPWTEQVVQDLEVLADFHRDKLNELGPPRSQPLVWHDFMLQFPGAFGTLVWKLHITTMPLDRCSENPPP